MSYQPPPQPWQPEQQPTAHYPAGGYPPPPPAGQYPPTRPVPPGLPQGMPAQWGPPPPAPKRSPLKILAIIGAAVVGVCLFGAAVNNLSGGKTTSSGSEPDAVASAGNGPAAAVATTPAGKPAGKPTAKAVEASQFDVPIGTTITASKGKGTITAVLRSVKTYKQGCNNIAPDLKNGLLVVVDVLVTQKDGTGSVNPLDFTFVAEDGTTANGLSAAFSGCDDPRLSSSELRAGQKRAGKIGFDINSASGSLEWAPGGLGAKTAGSWKTK